jgi:arabinogalactan oligomer / maltooligosaccharide transport system permease protein
MVGWSGRRTSLTILLFLLPTLIGVLVFSLFPIILNSYISFTNRNLNHPLPDCTVFLTSILDPTCWPAFADNQTVGLSTPYKLQSPILKNYDLLVGQLFNGDSLLALVRLLICLVPLFVASAIDKRLEKGVTRSVGSLPVWLGGIVGVVLIALIVDISGALDVLMNTGDFIIVVFRTILFVVLRVPISFLVGLVLALILNNQNLPGKTFFRVLLFVPWAASSIAILMALIWQFFFQEQGVLNQVLTTLGLLQSPIVFLNDPVYAFGVVVMVDVWFSYGFFMVSILGALQSIPVELYEAANVDGANWWTQLRTITLPLIRPAVLPAVVLTSITAFQMFGTAYAITAGGPLISASKPGATDFVMVYAFKQIFQTQNYGNATAFAVIIFIMLFAATLYSLRLTRITKSVYSS